MNLLLINGRRVNSDIDLRSVERPKSDMAEAINAKSLQNLIDDDFYKAVKDRFLRQGKGRRPDITSLPALCNKVVVQLWSIALDVNLPQRKAVEWLLELYPEIGRHWGEDRMRSFMLTTFKKAQEICEDVGKLLNFLETPLNLNFTTSELMNIGLDRHVLLSDFGYLNVGNLDRISNKIVLDLDSFQVSEKLEATFAARWIKHLCNLQMDDREIKNLVKKIKKLKERRTKLKTSKKTTPQIFDEFLGEDFKIRDDTKILTNENANDKNIKICDHDKVIEFLNKKVNNLESENSAAHQEIKTLFSVIADEKSSTKTLEAQLTDIKNEKDKIAEEKFDLEQQLKLAGRTIKTLKQKDSRDEEKIKLSYQAEIISLEEKNKKLKAKVSKLQTSSKQKKQTVDEEISKTTDTYVNLVEIKTNKNNTYSDAVRQTVIALHCDAGVSAENIKRAIEIVGSNIFNYTFKEDLPCAQTVSNILAEGGILSNIQISDTILKSNNVTLHTDGTSRDGNKIVGFQVSCDSGEPLFLGFEQVATEDAQTTLDIAISVLKKLSTCYDDLNNVDSFDNILGKITSVMTDRAATMKLFSQKLEEFLKSKFGQDVQLHFLKCNAHFLLGLMSECEKALAAVEEEIIEESGEPLGRDKDKSFSHFQKEKTVSGRVIRMVCEILGPRGDQKNGCRQDWVAFCGDSKIPCFKGNRFNCFFEAAAAIVFHFDKFKTFLTSGILGDNINLKIKSVSLDIQDKKIMCFLAAIALFYLKVTLPYWMLVSSSSVKYVDFHNFVKTLHHSLSDWSEDPEPLSDRNLNSVFKEFNPSSSFFSSVHDFVDANCDRSLVLKVLKALCKYSLVVTERQLDDFLTGKFSTVEVEEETRKTLDHCLLTNLIGESAFGDYDYDVSKRRNASLHNRSSLHTIKRNRTVKFLSKQSPKVRKDMFVTARKLGPEFRRESKAKEVRVKNEIRAKFVANQEKKIRKHLLEIERNSKILEEVKQHGGPCLHKEELDELILSLKNSKRTAKYTTEVLKSEIRFHKTFNHKNSLKFGNVTFMKDILRNCLPNKSNPEDAN